MSSANTAIFHVLCSILYAVHVQIYQGLYFSAYFILLLTGVAVACCGRYGRGTGAINVRNVICSGTEESVTTCLYNDNAVTSNHNNDVGVQCQQGWSYRLINKQISADKLCVSHSSPGIKYLK